MCTDDTPTTPAPEPPAVATFATTAEFLAAISPGMDLCTSDFTGWAVVESVIDGDAPVVVGRVKDDGRTVHVPAEVLIDLRGGHCVRFDRVRETVDRQGWDAP